MKKSNCILAIFILTSIFFSFLGCKQEPELVLDVTAPGNVTSINVTTLSDGICLEWVNPTDQDFDGILISMSPAEGTLKNAVMLGKDATSFDVSGLESGKQYTLTIKTFDINKNYSSGATVSATVEDTIAPKEVSNLVVTASNGNAVLSWINPADEDFAGVQISMNPAEGTLKNVVMLGKEATSFDVSGLTNGTEYTFTVKTFDTSLNYSEGASAKATVADTADYTAPANITNLTATASNGNAVLSWTNPEDEDFAGVQISMSPAAGTLKNAVTLGKEATSFDVSGLTNGAEYAFTVKTFDTSLNYSEGASAKATVADTADYTAPANVTELTVTASNGNAVLSWTNPEDEDFAGVQISMSPAEGTLKNAVTLGKEVTSLDVSGLTNGAEYAFTVKTFDTSLNYSEGVNTKTTVADTADYTAPANVTNLVATNKDGSVLLTWKDATDEDVFGYEVTWNQSKPINRSAAMDANSMMVAPGSEGCFISNLTNGTEYTFTVKSVDTSGNKSEGVAKSITPSIIEKSPLEISLTANTTDKTNQDVVISVDVETDKASVIKQLAYREGIFTKVEDVLSGTNITDVKEITVAQNGTITVVATDTAGRRELAFITIENIDKTAPRQITNVVPIYARDTNTIKLSWTNPTDSDFDGIEIVYGKTTSEEKTTLTFDKNTTSATIENIADDDSEYTIKLYSKDDVGNFGTANVVRVLAATGVKITNIALDRTHLDSIMTNRDIKVTITGSNFDLLTSLLLQVTDGSTSFPAVNATINVQNNTASATVTAPVPQNPSIEGQNYTIKAIINNTEFSDIVGNFVVTTPAEVFDIIFDESQIKLGAVEFVTAKITGTNFDIRGVTKVKLFNSIGEEVSTSTVTVPLKNNNSESEFVVSIPLPKESGVYTTSVFFDDVKDDFEKYLQVYDEPLITNISIPTAGESYGGNSLPITVYGKNFTAPDAVIQGFSVNGATLLNVIVESDTKAILEIMCPYTAGTSNVTVSYGSSKASSILKVVEAEKCFSVGDVLLIDGTRIKAENVQYGIPSEKAFAVVSSIDSFGGATGKAVGKYRGHNLCWATTNTTGYDTNFTGIQTRFDSGTNSFTGDLDGSDNWEEICKVDPVGANNASIYYPIFDFANNYGSTAGLTDTTYETGWYVPSGAELYEVYKNKDVIQTSLTAVSEFDFDTTFWTSSQRASHNDYAYQVYFNDGYVSTNYKGSNNSVFVLQAFNAEQFNNYVYGTPSITSIEIPPIGEGYTGDVPITIVGENLIGYEITCSNTTFSNLQYFGDSKVRASLVCNGTESGNSSISVTCGTSSSSGILEVVASEKCFTEGNIGDIVLSDGSFVNLEEFDSSTMTPIAVISGLKYNGGQALGIGLQKFEGMWAKKYSTGFYINFVEIQPDFFGSESAGYIFTGDLDGSDNWEYICKADPVGTQDAATNYPIFNFANNYGTTAGLIDTAYETGWYVPSVAEVYEVYKNKDIIQTSLTAVSGFDFDMYFWTSSQSASHKDYAYQVIFANGDVYATEKDSYNSVFVLQAFNAE